MIISFMNVIEKAEYGSLEPVSNLFNLASVCPVLSQSNSDLGNYFINSRHVFKL